MIATRPGQGARLMDGAGREIARLSYHLRPWPTYRGEVTLSFHPTQALDPAVACAPDGRWKITVSAAEIGPDQTVEGWVRRDETLPGFPNFGRQSYFDNGCYQRFDAMGAPLAVDPPGDDCPVRRAGSLSGFATGATPVVVAGFTQNNGILSDYSAAGPLSVSRDGGQPYRDGPDAAARSDDSPVLPGVLGAGSASGSMVRMNGTSVAAPLVARMMASGLELGEAGDRDWVRRRAAEDDKSYPAPKPAETRAGGGRLRLGSLFAVE